MEFDVESWMPYRCDFKPITTNSMFSDALGRIARMAMRAGSEFLYMESGNGCPVGTLVPENLIRPRVSETESSNFAMVFSYSPHMEALLYDLASASDSFGAGITLCAIWNRAILVDECKVLVVASLSPHFDEEAFLDSLDSALARDESPQGENVPYFAEKFGYRRFSIPYETDDVTDLQISDLLLSFEFDATRVYVGPMPEVRLERH